MISQQCRSGLQQLESDEPTVIPIALGPNGEQLVEVRVSADGELLTSRIDGRGVALDPGLHEFVFSSERGEVHTEKVLILEGQRNRVISVVLTPAAPAATRTDAAATSDATLPGAAPPSTSSSAVAPLAAASAQAPTPVEGGGSPPRGQASKPAAEAARAAAGNEPGHSLFPYILGGAGVVAIGGSFLLAHWGSESNDSLDACAPDCSRKSVDHVNDMYVAADVSLGVGVVALGVATWLYFSEASSERAPSEQAYRFDVKPTASGAFATVRSSF